MTDILRANSRSASANSVALLVTHSRARSTGSSWRLGPLSSVAAILGLVKLAGRIASNDGIDLVFIHLE